MTCPNCEHCEARISLLTAEAQKLVELCTRNTKELKSLRASMTDELTEQMFAVWRKLPYDAKEQIVRQMLLMTMASA